MGKNYTLYIKNDNFANESNKGGLVNKLLEDYYAGSSLEKIMSSTPGPSVNVVNVSTSRTPQLVLQEINQMERERDDKLEYCQDPLEAKRIGSDYASRIQLLWDEYHQLKENK